MKHPGIKLFSCRYAKIWTIIGYLSHLCTEDCPNVNFVGIPFSDLLFHILLVLEGLVANIDVSLQSEGELTVSEHLLVDCEARKEATAKVFARLLHHSPTSGSILCAFTDILTAFLCGVIVHTFVPHHEP